MLRSADQRVHARLRRAMRCAADPGPSILASWVPALRCIV